MQKLIILAAIAACCVAAPTSTHNPDVVSLQRPSPINPAVASDPKPAEKVTVITDAKEIAKFKRESGSSPQDAVSTHLTPTVAPAAPQAAVNKPKDNKDTGAAIQTQHHREKREDKKKRVSEVAKKAAVVTPAPPKRASVTPATPKKTPTTAAPKRTAPTTKKSTPAATKKSAPAPAPTKKSAAPAPTQKHRQKRDEANVSPTSSVVHRAVAVPLKLTNEEAHTGATAVVQTSPVRLPETEPEPEPIFAPIRHQHIGALFHAAEVQAAAAHPQTSTGRYPDLHGGHPATSFPIQGPTTPASHVEAKRDIPVPLVAKHHHPAESPKANEHEKHTDEIKDDVQVEDLSDKAPGIHRAQHQQQEHSHAETPAAVVVASSTATPASASTSSSSTTEHAFIRHHPVPVAELFARPKQPAN